MRFTSDEISFLTAIVKGPDPFGINIKRKHGEPAIIGAQNAKKALVEKGILCDGEITKIGLAAVRLWEDYCKAEHYLIISGNIIGLLPDRRCVIIVKVNDDYEIVSGDRVEIIKGMLISTPDLFRSDNKEASSVQLNEEINLDEFLIRLKSFSDKWFTLGYFTPRRKTCEESFVYWNENEFYMYNPHSCTQTTISPSAIRKKIVSYLELNLDDLQKA